MTRTFADIIAMWPSAETLSEDLGLKYRSHARIMKLRNSIPEIYWPFVLQAARRRGIPLTQDMLLEAGRQRWLKWRPAEAAA